MIRVFKNLFHQPAVRFGIVNDSRASTPIRSSLFVSFISETGCYRARHTDRYESHMRRRRLIKGALLIGLGALSAWIVLESAKALTMF